MGGFLYYRPGQSAPSPEMIEALGLSYAFSQGPDTRPVTSGPLGFGEGVVFCDGTRVKERCLLDLDAQEWIQRPPRFGPGEVCIGWWKDDPPQPEALEREEMLDGFRLRVADGRRWRVPVVRAFDAGSGEQQARSLLPAFTGLDKEGRRVRGAHKAVYQWLWDLTEEPWQKMLSGEDIPLDSLVPVVAGLFKANYAVDAVELYAMNVFDDAITEAGVVALAIDYSTFKSWHESIQKKKNSEATGDSSLSSNGQPVCSPATNQPALTN